MCKRKREGGNIVYLAITCKKSWICLNFKNAFVTIKMFFLILEKYHAGSLISLKKVHL